MAVAVVYEFPPDGIEAYERSLVVADGVLTRQRARLSHVCYRTSKGYTVLDVWESEEAFEQFGDLLNQVMDTFPSTMHLEVHPVHNLITG
jgi:heme-degrading monooxygenase HmoA